MSEARSWSHTSLCVVDGGQDMAAVFALGERETASYRGTDVRLAHWLRETSRGARPHCPTDKNIRQWLGPKGACGKVSHVSRLQVKQALVQQGMYTEQENSHLEWSLTIQTQDWEM